MHDIGRHDRAVGCIQRTLGASHLPECENLTWMRSLGVSPKPHLPQFRIHPMSALFKRSWPSTVKHYHFAYFWRTPTPTLCSINNTCCRASFRRRRSHSSRRGLTGNCCRALSRRLSKQFKDVDRRITEAQSFGTSGYPVTLENCFCYRATLTLLSGPSWRAKS